MKNSALTTAAACSLLGASSGTSAWTGRILHHVETKIGVDAMAAALSSLAGTHVTTTVSRLSDLETKIATNRYDLGSLSR